MTLVMVNNIIGHTNTKKQLEVAIEAARKRNMSIPHMLFSGAAGCGKTSLAQYVAELAGVPFMSVVPNDIKDYDSVLKVLDRFNTENYDAQGNRVGIIKPTILFLDEVHNLPLKGQELLGLVMERFKIESRKPDKYYWVPFFCLVGATTIAGKLSKPFRDRFKLVFNFQPYPTDEMLLIVGSHAKRLGVRMTIPSAMEVAKRSRGTPRIAVGFVERVRDCMISLNIPVATEMLVIDMFNEMGIDEEGLSTLERRILKSLFDAGVPVSLDNLSTILQEDSKSIRDFAEPFLIRKELILISGKGRVITEKGVQHLTNIGRAGRLVKQEISFDYERN